MARYFGTNIISKDISGLTSSQYAAINSTITKAKVDDIVTLTTAQNISGKKNFTNDVSVTKSIPVLEIKDSNSLADLTLASRSTAHTGARVRLLDCKGKKVTSIYNIYSATGDAYTKIQHNSKSGKTIELGLGFDANEVGIATAPTPTSATDQASTQIATTGWVNKKGNNVVHISDAETITGAKTFTSEIKGRFRSASYHQGEDNTNSWFKLGTFQSTGTYHNQILIFTLWQGTAEHDGTVSGRIFTRTGGNNVAGAFSSAGIEFDYKTTWLNLDNFKLLYKENQGTTNKYVLFELWAKTPSAYTGGVFSILDERASAEEYNTSWVLYTKPAGVTALPTDYVAISSKLANHNIALNSDVVHIANTETITGAKTFSAITTHNKEVVVTAASPSGQFRAIGGNYGFIVRNDGADTYFLLTNSGNASGTWNDLRPLQITNSTGNVTCGTSWTFSKDINGTALKAKWADLAENYVSDTIYPIGTLIKFGGEADITIADDNCNGAISDKPGYLLDAELEGGQPIALVGKTPIRIIGKINKHDKVTLSEIPGVGRVATEGEKVIARALESSDNDDEKLIMCVTKFNLD
jgi:hypothetical protein